MSTPETDQMATMRRTHQEWQAHGERLERERDEARESLAAAEAWSATLADVGDDFRWECSELRAAIRNLRDVKGRHHTQLATERLFGLLPESSSQPDA